MEMFLDHKILLLPYAIENINLEKRAAMTHLTNAEPKSLN